MKIKKLNILSFLALVLLTACFKEDERVEPHKSGDLKLASVAMENDYRYQVYFDLQTGKVVKKHLKTSWDLAFENAPGGDKIVLNSSLFMMAAKTQKQGIQSQVDTTGLQWHYDAASGNTDSLAIDNWYSVNAGDTILSKQLFIIDRGLNLNGNSRGYRQMMVSGFSRQYYEISHAQLDGSGQMTVRIERDTTRNYTYFSFETTNENLPAPPPKNNWDLLFTQYTKLLYTDEGEPYPYLVTGVLLNQHKVMAAEVTSGFENITLEYAQGISYTDVNDVIGYDWKTYDFDAGSYTVDPDKIFLIKGAEGFYYKLRFVGFYSNTGEKGHPTFEYRQL